MTTPFIDAGPFRPEPGADFSALRERFRQAGFTERAVHDALEGRSDRNIDFHCAIRRSADPSPFNLLLRLFVLGMPVAAQSACSALAPVDIGWLIDCGLIEPAAEGLRATARLMPWRDLFLLSDFPPAEGQPIRPDFVMSGSSPSSVSLTMLVPRNRVATVLDIGSGAGIHALLAAGHADRVIATDINPRALNFASMNARLNGIGNISFVLGSFFEPAGSDKFDLILSNPPFIISPQSSLIFQNPGFSGDGVSELILREAPAHLNEGGCAISLISWHYESDDDWAVRPCGWAASSGCDLWLLLAAAEDPLSYAANALRQTESIAGPRYAQLLDEWVAYYRQQNIVRLALGAAILRKRRTQRNWVHCEKLAGAPLAGDAGEQIRRVFAAEDFLESLDGDQALLDCRLALHPDHLLEHKLTAGDDGWISQSLILMPARGIEHHAAIDSHVLAFLSQCNGARTIRELITAIAANDGMDFTAAADAGLPLVRRLLRAGFLVVK